MWAVRGGMDDGTGGARTSPLPPGLGRSSVLGPPFRARFPSEPILKSRVAHREHQSAPGFGSRIHPIELGWLGEDGELGDPAGIPAVQPRAFPPPPPAPGARAARLGLPPRWRMQDMGADTAWKWASGTPAGRTEALGMSLWKRCGPSADGPRAGRRPRQAPLVTVIN